MIKCFLELHIVLRTILIIIYGIQSPTLESQIMQFTIHSSTEQVEYSCNKFIRIGILCSHAFFALAQGGIHKIPPQYIINRRMNNAKKRYVTKH